MPHCLCPLKEAAKDAPHSIGFRSKEFSLTFAELDAKTEQTAAELFAMGLREKDRLAVYLPAGIRFYTLLFASLRLGALFCPLNLRLPPTSIEEHLSLFSPKLLAVPDGLQVRPTRFCDLPASSLLVFTSGSTGAPKLAVLSLLNLRSNARSASAFCNLRPGDRWLLSLPLHHVGGLAILFRCLSARATLTTDPSDLEVSHLSYVPAQLYRSWPVYPRLRCLLLGGGPIQEIPSQLPIAISYAMTETASLIIGCKQPLLNIRKGSSSLFLGFPLPGKEIKLSRDGEILVRGDSLFCGYWDGQLLRRPVDREGWFATKDLGRFDPKRGFAITGRKDNQFISGGENIQPEEIEQALYRYPGVIDAIVVPIEDTRFGFRPIACLRTSSGSIESTAIQQFLAEQLPKYKIPASFFLLDDLAEIGLKTPRKQIIDLMRRKVLK